MADTKPKHKDLEHGSTVVVVTNSMELVVILNWCTLQGKSIAAYMRDVNEFPYCLSVSGDAVGWTNDMDRALYYMPFGEFIVKSGKYYETTISAETSENLPNQEKA